MIRPGRLGLRLLAGCAACAVGAAVWWPVGILALGAGLAVAIAAWQEARALARVRLEARWPAQLVLPIGVPAGVPVVVAALTPEAVDVQARVVWPDALGGGSGSLHARVAGGGEAVATLPVLPRARGATVVEPPYLAWTRWGLAERIAQTGDPLPVDVLPDLTAVRRLHAQITSLFLRGHGQRLAPRVGQGREFDRLREYVTGDDYRHVAWKPSARRGRLIVRSYRVERAQDVLLCIDQGHRMGSVVATGQGLLTRLDHAVNAGVLAAWLSARCEDRVGLCAFAAGVDRGVPQGRGASHLGALTTFATRVGTTALATDYRALAAHVRRRLRSRSLILLFTVLPERGDHGDLLAAVRMLLPRHLPLLLVLDDRLLQQEAAAEPTTHAGLARMLAAADIVDGRAQLTQELRSCGALVVHTTPADAGVAAVNAYLDVKRRQLL